MGVVLVIPFTRPELRQTTTFLFLIWGPDFPFLKKVPEKLHENGHGSDGGPPWKRVQKQVSTFYCVIYASLVYDTFTISQCRSVHSPIGQDGLVLSEWIQFKSL